MVRRKIQAALGKGIKTNTSLHTIRGLPEITHNLHLQYYLFMNRAGRRLLNSSQPIPNGWWPRILWRAGDRFHEVARRGSMFFRSPWYDAVYFLLRNCPEILSSFRWHDQEISITYTIGRMNTTSLSGLLHFILETRHTTLLLLRGGGTGSSISIPNEMHGIRPGNCPWVIDGYGNPELKTDAYRSLFLCLMCIVSPCNGQCLQGSLRSQSIFLGRNMRIHRFL